MFVKARGSVTWFMMHRSVQESELLTRLHCQPVKVQSIIEFSHQIELIQSNSTALQHSARLVIHV